MSEKSYKQKYDDSISKRVAKKSQGDVLLWFHNEYMEQLYKEHPTRDLKDLPKSFEEIPTENKSLLLELGRDLIAKMYARRLFQENLNPTEIATKSGLTIDVVRKLKPK